jgi:hypothetical protein
MVHGELHYARIATSSSTAAGIANRLECNANDSKCHAEVE